ncbi:hypothetical protein B0H10DRAFT_1957210 [Mycena sp. CBHHK59/15]|nr:hypothetical protein B0H10DRAFT_1957210 [Mycena sp. CBHHK59/15]
MNRAARAKAYLPGIKKLSTKKWSKIMAMSKPYIDSAAQVTLHDTDADESEDSRGLIHVSDNSDVEFWCKIWLQIWRGSWCKKDVLISDSGGMACLVGLVPDQPDTFCFADGRNAVLSVAFYRVCEFALERRILEGELDLEDKIRVMTACRVLETAGCRWHVTLAVARGGPSAVINQGSHIAARQKDGASALPAISWPQCPWMYGTMYAGCARTHKTILMEWAPRAVFGLPEWSKLEKMQAEALE